jgi:DNA helicase-2/ATP-dependent DNA helicase PcrA
VLFLTFSRTAVAQIAKHAPGVFAGTRNRVEISTFHAFAFRLIRAFGRYAGFGATLPALQSEARVKLFGRQGLTYDDLVPGALRVLGSSRVRELVARRWPLVICDEFQDTNSEQWELLQLLSTRSRMVLLADPNQMIYTFISGVGPKRLEEARALAHRAIQLEPKSHRDPSGMIPALGTAVRLRQFEHEAVGVALSTGRLRVFAGVADDDLMNVIVPEVHRLQAGGCRSVGIFGHSNAGVALLGAALAEAGLDHTLIGIPEAHGEAIAAMAAMCAFGAGIVPAADDYRSAFAVFLTACTRGAAPALAVSLAKGGWLPDAIRDRLTLLETALRDAASNTVSDLVEVSAQAWEAIGITSGRRPWRRAALDFAALARPWQGAVPSEGVIAALVERAKARRGAALVDFDATHLAPVQLMNFHQTKGREADAVVLVYRDGDYLADRRDTEPFVEPSRVLFVSITRARREVVLILPSDPHPLVGPFANLARVGEPSP